MSTDLGALKMNFRSAPLDLAQLSTSFRQNRRMKYHLLPLLLATFDCTNLCHGRSSVSLCSSIFYQLCGPPLKPNTL